MVARRDQERVRLSLREAFPLYFGERWEEARDIYLERFRAIHLERLTPLPGRESMLRNLAGQGIYLGVVSNKTGDLLRREVARLGWTDLFGSIIGAGDAPLDKPACEPVRLALAASGVPAGDEVWFVGDTAVDMECAGNSGCIAVFLGDPMPPRSFPGNSRVLCPGCALRTRQACFARWRACGSRLRAHLRRRKDASFNPSVPRVGLSGSKNDGRLPMSSEKSQNVQDVFLNHVRKNKTPVTVFLVNGVKLQGIITWFDNFCVLLRRDAHSQLVYKHAISTVMPAQPIQLFEGGKEPNEF